MSDLLANPVYAALTSRDRHLGEEGNGVAWFDAEVSPFAGFPEEDGDGFLKLQQALPAGRGILFGTPHPEVAHPGWTLVVKVEGVQMVQVEATPTMALTAAIRPLEAVHVPQMVDLARRTKPGPFGSRTIEFGHYHGIFEGDKLVAMTGQRLHLPGRSEISAVCTDPEHLGKGYATELVYHQAELIRAQGDQPYLHVRADNARAIAVYERLGFRITRPMHFYFLKALP